MQPANGQWTLEIVEVPFSVKRRGTETRYVLCEASEPAVAAYRAEQFKGVQSVEGPDGQTKIVVDLSKTHHVHESKLMLLGDCVRPVDASGAVGPPLGSDELRNPDLWSHRLIEQLFDRAERMSLLKAETRPPAEQLRQQIADLQEQLAEVEAEEETVKN